MHAHIDGPHGRISQVCVGPDMNSLAASLLLIEAVTRKASVTFVPAATPADHTFVMPVMLVREDCNIDVADACVPRETD